MLGEASHQPWLNPSQSMGHFGCQLPFLSTPSKNARRRFFYQSSLLGAGPKVILMLFHSFLVDQYAVSDIRSSPNHMISSQTVWRNLGITNGLKNPSKFLRSPGILYKPHNPFWGQKGYVTGGICVSHLHFLHLKSWLYDHICSSAPISINHHA